MGWCLFKWLVMWVTIGVCGADDIGTCDMQSCSNTFLARTKTLKPGPYLPYCVHLRAYMQCVQEQAKACHGELMFHGIKISVETLMADHRCEEILEQELPDGADSVDSDAYPHFVPDDPCGYKGPPSSPAHCGLFGDPHLKTFNGTFMTCRVKGAWPMLSSSHLAIQVTNEAVAPDFKATATTKVTVLVKASSSCGTAKMYEASGDSLPRAFIDGTTFSGSDRNRPFANVTEAESGRHVLIYIKNINTVVSIRKVGHYLSVSVTMPETLLEDLNDSLQQLCVGGCPASEQLREGSVSGPKNPAMSEAQALSLCREHNVTDYYLDSCVFDLITTGDLNFREAAALSLKDLWIDVPKSSNSLLKNCTAWPCVWKVTSGQSRFAADLTFIIFWSLIGYLIKSLMILPTYFGSTVTIQCIIR